MKIVRVFNNNIVSTVDKDNKEVIVQGAGVGFNKKPGDLINQNNIEKVFHIRDAQLDKYQQFFENVPIDYFEVSEVILKKAEDELSTELNTQAVLALADHIYHAVNREKNGTPLSNLMLDEIKVLYFEEFEIACWALGVIEKFTHFRLSDDEAGYIALHIVNANMKLEAESTTKMLRYMRGILDLIKINLNLDLDPQDFNTSRLMTHLKFLSLRIFNNDSQKIEVLDDMYELLLAKEPKMKVCLEQIGIFTKREFDHDFSKTEEIYLMVHILKLI